MTPSSRREADKQLLVAMSNASRGIGTIIKLGKSIVDDEDGLDEILTRLKDILMGARQRVLLSYALLLHSTFKVSVCYSIQCLYTVYMPI